MTGLGFLDLVIGLVFIYFILSLVVTVIQEIRANLFRLRSKNLEKWFEDTFNENTGELGKAIFSHKLIKGLVRKNRNPSYVPHEHFVSALFDIVHKDASGDDIKTYDIKSLTESIKKSKILPEDLQRFILQSLSEAKDDLNKVKKDIASWFDDAMIRITGTYKNIHQWFVLSVSLIIVALFNADTLSLTKYLYENESARIELADKASEAVMDNDIQELMDKYASIDTVVSDEKLDSVKVIFENIETGIQDIKNLNTKIKDYNLPLGWTKEAGLPTTFPSDFLGWLMKIIGLFITAMAVSLGSSFWFDLLNKLVNLRAAGKIPKDTVEKAKDQATQNDSTKP